jgi:hypothetical protein
MRTSLLIAASLALAAVACGPNETHPLPGTYVGEAGAPLPCVPNLDGTIDANELAPALGIPATYLISPIGTTRAVDITGATDASGQLTWDWSTSYSDDGAVAISASALAGQWYASSFPGGQFVVQYDASDTLEAVYSHDGQAMLLYGLASHDPAPAEGKTLIVYAQPVSLYEFPFHAGSTWTSVGNVMNATLRGLQYAGTDTYVTTDDATGTMILPDLTFTQAHRVRTTLSNNPAVGEASTTRQVSFIFECFGEVARATSQTNETKDDFTTAAEVRRLGVSP